MRFEGDRRSNSIYIIITDNQSNTSEIGTTTYNTPVSNYKPYHSLLIIELRYSNLPSIALSFLRLDKV
jgi:hypothetical protein